jgi:hypothetical protein
MGPVVTFVAAATIARVAPDPVSDVDEKIFAYRGICSKVIKDTHWGGRSFFVMVRLCDALNSTGTR